MACNENPVTITPITPAKGDEVILDVIPKYKKLMAASLGEDSLYERSKKTIFELSKDLNMTEAERMEVVAGQITQMTIGLTSHAMTQGVAWAKEDALIGYATAKLKAEAELTATKAETEAFNKCKVENEAALVCAQITATLSGSFRENGRPKTYSDTDKCIPTSLYDEGLKWEQTLQVDASTYQILADAFRKSGVVQLGTEGGQLKGISGDNDGHTKSQTSVANRQVLSFEDSKRNHAVNASSQTIGQMVAAEAPVDDDIIRNYNKGMEYLLTDSTPIIPGGNVDLDPVTIDWSSADTDTVDNPAGPTGNLTSQKVSNQVTLDVQLLPNGNARNGDNLMLRIDGGEYLARHILTETDITTNSGIIEMTFPSVDYNAGGSSTMVYDIEAYVQDVAGNTSYPVAIYTLSVRYVPFN